MSLTYDIEDEHEQLSTDCVQLNASMVEMRQLAKKAKVHVIHELAVYIKRLKKKQSLAPTQKKTRIGKKILGRLSEIRLLKKIGAIRLCKLILANTTTLEEMKKCGQNLSKQDRIVVRLAARPEILSFVYSFRSQHTDWQTLVHYLLYKNTSGKWKSREQKRRASKKKGELPFPLQSELPASVKTEDDPPSSIAKFAVFKESHDRQLLEAHKKILADEAAETGSLGSFPTQLYSRNPLAPSPDEDSDTASQIAEKIVTNLSKRRKKNATSDSSQLLSDKTSAETKSEDKLSTYTNDNEGPLPVPLKNSPSRSVKTSSQTKAKDGNSEYINENKDSLSMQPKNPAVKSRKRGIKAESDLRTAGRNISESRNISASIVATVDTLTTAPLKSIGDVAAVAEKEYFLEEVSNPLLFEDESECPLGDDDMTMVQEFKEKRATVGGKLAFQNSSWRATRGRFHGVYGSNSNSNSGKFAEFSRNVPLSTRGGGGKKGHRQPASRSEVDEPALHPSWAAKRAQKQAISVSAGKRIVFSE